MWRLGETGDDTAETPDLSETDAPKHYIHRPTCEALVARRLLLLLARRLLLLLARRLLCCCSLSPSRCRPTVPSSRSAAPLPTCSAARLRPVFLLGGAPGGALGPRLFNVHPPCARSARARSYTLVDALGGTTAHSPIHQPIHAPDQVPSAHPYALMRSACARR
jgi:hypothetical protein